MNWVKFWVFFIRVNFSLKSNKEPLNYCECTVAKWNLYPSNLFHGCLHKVHRRFLRAGSRQTLNSKIIFFRNKHGSGTLNWYTTFFHTIFHTFLYLPTIGSRLVTREKKASNPKTHRYSEGFVASDLKNQWKIICVPIHICI